MVLLGSFLLACAALASSQAQLSTTGIAPGRTPLRELAQRRRLVLGSAVAANLLRANGDDGRYVATTTSTFDMIEPENDAKPPSIWSGPRDYRFSDLDFLLGAPGKKGWAQQHKMKFRGHVLVYARDDGYTLPQWLRKNGEALSKDEARELLHDYIRAVAGRYRGKVAMWDVANEAIDDGPNDNPFNLRSSFWFRKLGPEFLVLAFKWAKEADPKAELYYNDYGIEEGGKKGQHVLDLVKWLKEQGAPIDGVGLQYHIGLWTSITPGDGHYQYIDEIGKLRLSYMMTELDVAVPVTQLPAGDPNRGLVPQDPAGLKLQADIYAAVFKMALASKHCHGINIWGLTDRYSWIPMISGGRNGAATLYDKDYHPKLAYDAIEAVLRR